MDFFCKESLHFLQQIIGVDVLAVTKLTVFVFPVCVFVHGQIGLGEYLQDIAAGAGSKAMGYNFESKVHFQGVNQIVSQLMQQLPVIPLPTWNKEINTAPTKIKISAILRTGQTRKSIKSTTYLVRSRSIIFPRTPPVRIDIGMVTFGFVGR